MTYAKWSDFHGKFTFSEEEIEKHDKLMQLVRQTAEHRSKSMWMKLLAAYDVKLMVHDEITPLGKDEMTDVPKEVFMNTDFKDLEERTVAQTTFKVEGDMPKFKAEGDKGDVDTKYSDYGMYGLKVGTLKRNISLPVDYIKGKMVEPVEPVDYVVTLVPMEEHKKALARIDLLEKQLSQLTEKVSALIVKSEAQPVAEPKKESYWR